MSDIGYVDNGACLQVLTHIREKLKFTENQNSVVKKTLGEVERAILIQRGALTATKHDRDYVRDDNAELKRKQVGGGVRGAVIFNHSFCVPCVVGVCHQ